MWQENTQSDHNHYHHDKQPATMKQFLLQFLRLIVIISHNQKPEKKENKEKQMEDRIYIYIYIYKRKMVSITRIMLKRKTTWSSVLYLETLSIAAPIATWV